MENLLNILFSFYPQKLQELANANLDDYIPLSSIITNFPDIAKSCNSDANLLYTTLKQTISNFYVLHKFDKSIKRRSRLEQILVAVEDAHRSLSPNCPSKLISLSDICNYSTPLLVLQVSQADVIEAIKRSSKKTVLVLIGSSVAIASLERSIARQLDFYFSEDNYPNDKFLKSQEDADKCIKLSIVLGFAKMKQLLANTKDEQQVLKNTWQYCKNVARVDEYRIRRVRYLFLQVF